MNRNRLAMILTWGFLGLALVALWLLAPTDACRLALAQSPDGASELAEASPAGLAGILTVCPVGPPDCDYAVVQDAVDAAAEGDVIKIAAGTYTEVQGRPVPAGYLNPPPSGVITQVVYISKTLTVRGGYTTTNGFAEPSDPVAYPTTLDAEEQGRALLVEGDISLTTEGLRITGGDATGLGGYSGVNWPDFDTGGGVFVIGATGVLSNNWVFGNTAGAYGSGGGLYLLDSDAALRGNTVTANTANALYGGGLYTLYSDGELVDNVFSGNSAGWGGAVFLEFSPAMLAGNDFSGNSCVMAGGALNVHTSDATITGNTVSENQATQAGGGMRLYDSAALVSGNVISGNVTTGYGGAVHLWSSNATLDGNLIAHNAANSSAGAVEFWFSDATLANNVIADNQAGDVGTAMYILASYPRLLHNTIARNTGTEASDGSAIFVDNYQTLYSTVWLTDTILVSHTVGITVTAGNTAMLEATLWGDGAWANGEDWGGAGTVITGTVNLWGDPAFVAPDPGDYHIDLGSAAVDAGVNAGVTTDIDGEPRPYGLSYDIGADELQPALEVTKQADREFVRSGSQLTYTLHLANTGPMTLTATITDVLPEHIAPTGILTWAPSPLLPGGAWTETVIVTVETGYTGLLTNVVQVSTEEGAKGAYTSTVTAEEAIAGLEAGNDAPTVLGEPTALTATVTAGSNVTYTWAFGDGETGSGAIVTHMYPDVGIYAVIVTASNSVSELTATTTITVDEAIAGLEAINDSPTVLGTPTTLTATVTAGSNVAYTWAFGDGEIGSGAAAVHTYPSADVYFAVVTASNSVGLLSTTTTVEIAELTTYIYLPLVVKER